MQHPDEGTIHAWLDGALSPAEARALEEHAAGCSECAAAIAEARGLVAASSRILSSLDSVPGGVLPSAAAAEALGAERPGPRVQRTWWRSVPLRAAAAIVLVGSVSWLATRSAVQRAPNATVAIAAAEDRMQALDTVSMPDSGASTAQAAPKNAPAARKQQTAAEPAAPAFVPPRPVPTVSKAPSPREDARIVAQSAAAADASTGDAIARESRPNVATANTAPVDSGSAAPRAGEARRLLASPSARAQAPMAMMSAPMAAALMPGSEALRQLAGCYTLEPPRLEQAALSAAQTAAQTAATAGAQPAPLLPARIELRTERADTGDAAAMVAQAAGDPPLAATTRASWKTLGDHAIELRIADGPRSLVATLTLAGNSVSGWARTSTNGRADAAVAVRGRRAECPATSRER